MRKIKEFSIAQRINVSILGEVNKECDSFLNKIYKNFDPLCEDEAYTLTVKITDEIPKISPNVHLGKDGCYDDKTLILKSGHFFIREGERSLIVGIPTNVKRGRVPFKRVVSGRHITDEIIEPLLQLILMKCEATFVHASSVFVGGKVDVLMGWRGTGKTNAILKDMNSKEIWSDDLTIMDSKGFVYPYLRPIRIYSYNIPLLPPNYIKQHNLNLKKTITPPWRPVHYLELSTELSSKKAPLNKLIYLNDKNTTNLAKDAKKIMDFEQLFFKGYQIMLEQSKVLQTENKVKSIINEALINSQRLNSF